MGFRAVGKSLDRRRNYLLSNALALVTESSKNSLSSKYDRALSPRCRQILNGDPIRRKPVRGFL